MAWKQAERLPSDGAVGVFVLDEDHLVLETNEKTLVMSRYNAARAFAMLGFMLGIDLPPRIGRAIKL